MDGKTALNIKIKVYLLSNLSSTLTHLGNIYGSQKFKVGNLLEQRK